MSVWPSLFKGWVGGFRPFLPWTIFVESGAKFYFEEILGQQSSGSRGNSDLLLLFCRQGAIAIFLTISAVVFDFRCHQFDQLLTSCRVDHGLGRRLDN